MNKYKQIRTCSNCGFTEERFIEKTKAAFESERKWKSPCVKCKHVSFKSGSCITPEPDAELLSIWAKSNKLRFIDQDEDLILGQPKYFDLLVEFIQNETVRKGRKGKKRILLSAIRIILHNISPKSKLDKEPDNLDTAEKIKNFLALNKWLFDQLGKKHIPKYLQDIEFKEN